MTVALKFYIRLLMLSPLHISRRVIKEINHESGIIECFDMGHVAVLIASKFFIIRHQDEFGANAGYSGIRT